MISAAVARRYARGLMGAVLELGAEGQGLEDVARDLSALADTVARFNGLELVVLNPAIDSDRKAAVLSEVATELGAGEVTRRFLRVLAEHERLDHLGAVAELYAGLVDEHRGIINAAITSPAPLDDTALNDLEERLAQSTGRTVRLAASTDPSLLGGLTTKIGDVVYDGSLRHQLARLREQMTES